MKDKSTLGMKGNRGSSINELAKLSYDELDELALNAKTSEEKKQYVGAKNLKTMRSLSNNPSGMFGMDGESIVDTTGLHNEIQSIAGSDRELLEDEMIGGGGKNTPTREELNERLGDNTHFGKPRKDQITAVAYFEKDGKLDKVNYIGYDYEEIVKKIMNESNERKDRPLVRMMKNGKEIKKGYF